MPEPGPLGETFFEASERAMVAASLVKSPLGGKVETVLTLLTQRLEPDLEDFPGITKLLAGLSRRFKMLVEVKGEECLMLYLAAPRTWQILVFC
jgi:hypothetical protein